MAKYIQYTTQPNVSGHLAITFKYCIFVKLVKIVTLKHTKTPSTTWGSPTYGYGGQVLN